MSVSNPSTFIGHLRRNTEVLFHLGCPSLSPHCTQRSFQRGNGENLKANALFPPVFYQGGILGLGSGRQGLVLECVEWRNPFQQVSQCEMGSC